jgi:hypothetical protein
MPVGAAPAVRRSRFARLSAASVRRGSRRHARRQLGNAAYQAACYNRNRTIVLNALIVLEDFRNVTSDYMNSASFLTER